MNNKLFDIFSNLNFVQSAKLKLEQSESNLSIKTLYGSAKSLFIASLLHLTSKRYFVLVPNKELADDFYDDLTQLMPLEEIFYFSRHKKQATNLQLGNDTSLAELIDNIVKFQSLSSSVAIATPEIFKTMLPKSEVIEKHITTLTKGQTIDLQTFTTELSLNGFQREQYVSKQGEYAVRGGIIDIFAPNMREPLRLELWGDEIDSLRFFDVLTQRSSEEVETVDFISSIFVDEQDYIDSTIYDHIKPETVFIIDSPESIDFSISYLSSIKDYRSINLNPLGAVDISVACTSQPNVQSSVYRLAIELQKNKTSEIVNFIAADSEIHLKRLQDLLDETMKADDLLLDDMNDSSLLDNIKYDSSDVFWDANSLSTGFFMVENKLSYFVENVIFARKRTIKSNKSKISKSLTLKELRQLNYGDYIVHDDKGIGKFGGFQSIEIGGSRQDCLKMFFADDDILYVHLNYLHKIQKYSAADGAIPRLSKLGSTEWLRKKDRTKRRIKDIARDLITLYAKRKMQKGFAFPQDGHWQKEFEASFIYEDTIDQARATAEVKRDMESEIPMDRLICGDVGFGKTEVAIRAAFKAATASKQTAVLVPTTILAQQHYQSFVDRMERYPIKVEMLSRFRTAKESKEILQQLKTGKVDIVIGTHRLLSKDIDFKDLALLIIDEEHRFGVAAKEKLRQLKLNVDTLTLTATPIPRTLNFSLMGARDLTQIETPPRNRLPVLTEIGEWDLSKITEIIIKEIKRSGQVFLVNDRVIGLDKIAMDLQMLMPSLRIAEVHGQMPASRIEKTMANFIGHKIDVLLATKIIEAGIDIPNANTIIINNAQNFGLAELYQLRGRVGRSNIQAYCYLFVPNLNHLPPKSLQRLLAIEEFTDLGSGLQLAMRDLEIRGAGDLLGAEQSGFIAEIGFDLYQKVLSEAVKELKDEEFSDLFEKEEHDDKLFDLSREELVVETNKDAFFPPDYLEDDTERFRYYKELFEVTTNGQLTNIISEIEDKYGKLPEEARELMFVIKLRVAAMGTGFVRVIVKSMTKLVLEFPDQGNAKYYEKVFPIVLEYLQLCEGVYISQHKNKLFLTYQAETRNDMSDFIWKIKKSIDVIL